MCSIRNDATFSTITYDYVRPINGSDMEVKDQSAWFSAVESSKSTLEQYNKVSDELTKIKDKEFFLPGKIESYKEVLAKPENLNIKDKFAYQ